MRGKAWRAAAGAFGLALMAGGAHAAPARSLPEGATYVAMGSSFAAGPGVAERAPGSVGGCRQSQDNYPRQVARAHKLKLIDKSCSGATTVDVLRGGQYGLPPQIDGLTADTRLVTVTIGGNDVRYMADLGVGVCRTRATGACTVPVDFDLEQAFAVTASNLRAIVGEVHKRSPQARLVFVDYITVLPPGPPCAAVALSTADADALRARSVRLARLTQEVAAEAKADLVKASDLTRGHDACAADAWVQGAVPTPGSSDWAPIPFHPRLAAMTAIARALDETLAR